MKYRRFAIRTIRNGEVIIDGVRYRPRQRHVKYDGRLDGYRYVFGRYPRPWRDDYEPFVCLWGLEVNYYNDMDWVYGPEDVDGSLPWDFWSAVDEEGKELADKSSVGYQ